jgi:hypothetical protein
VACHKYAIAMLRFINIKVPNFLGLILGSFWVKLGKHKAKAEGTTRQVEVIITLITYISL